MILDPARGWIISTAIPVLMGTIIITITTATVTVMRTINHRQQRPNAYNKGSEVN